MKTITTTKEKFVDLYSGLHSVKTLKSKKLALVAGRNMSILTSSLKDLEQANIPSKEFMELADKVNAITRSNPENGAEQVAKLEEENKEIVEKRRQQVEKVKELMQIDLTLDLHTIDVQDLPEEVNAEQIVLLDLIINE
tara:strand:+ start:2888 stop:3304 length:417 start_codon:yes stop_codon:yes gene_type:complete